MITFFDRSLKVEGETERNVCISVSGILWRELSDNARLANMGFKVIIILKQ